MVVFTKENSDTKIRNVETSDLAAVYALYSHIEPEESITNIEYSNWWQWLHVYNPTKLRYATGVFDADGNNLAHVSIVGFKYSINGVYYIAGFPCQLMVLQSKRKSLFYPILVTSLLKNYNSFGYDFCYAPITRPRVMQSNIALGFKPIMKVPVYARPIKLNSIFRKYFRIIASPPILEICNYSVNYLFNFFAMRADSSIEVKQEKMFDERINGLFSEMIKSMSICAVRDCNIMNWRFFYNHSRLYEVFFAYKGESIVGYTVTRRMKMKDYDVLAIVDFYFSENCDKAGVVLLNKIHVCAKEYGVDMCAILLNSNSKFTSLFRKFFYMKTPESFTLTIHDNKKIFNNIQMTDLTSWHITWFDHDYV
jgi:hypothetical protein